MRPHQRKNAVKDQKGRSEAVDPNRPVFFYMPNEGTYGIFCQWHSTRYEVPLISLSWLRTTHPKSAIKTIPEDENLRTFTFNCSEQFMMYSKALYFSDPESGAKILASSDPKEQKRLGREVKGWDDYIWLQVCERVAFEGNWWKFGPNRGWREVLLSTDEREICEASSRDRRWGIGYNEKNAMQYRSNWGENLLGKALMRVRWKVRERLKEIEEGVRTDWDLPDLLIWEEENEVVT